MSGRRNGAGRAHLAYLAARLMAEDGIADFASARRKVARQQGVRNDRELPDDREIAAALRSYQALYLADRQTGVLQRLRSTAVEAMELLHEFNPWLVGPVLNGTAGSHADVQLHLHTDRDKDLPFFLLGRGIECVFSERRLELGGNRVALIPLLMLEFEGAMVEASVFNSQQSRQFGRSPADGAGQARARLEAVRALLEADHDDGDDVGLDGGAPLLIPPRRT